MRGSDFVDLLLDLLPRQWVRLGLLSLCVVMALTHWYEPVTWYLLDKAAGVSEQITPIVVDMFTSLATPAGS